MHELIFEHYVKFPCPIASPIQIQTWNSCLSHINSSLYNLGPAFVGISCTKLRRRASSSTTGLVYDFRSNLIVIHHMKFQLVGLNHLLQLSCVSINIGRIEHWVTTVFQIESWWWCQCIWLKICFLSDLWSRLWNEWLAIFLDSDATSTS